MDYYQILGVERNADAASIKKAYRQLAMKFHPDRNPGDKAAEEKFKEAARAYEVLGNDEKRTLYDRYGEAGVSGQSGFGGGQGFHDVNDIFSSFGDIFGDVFGGARQGRGRRNAAREGSDLRYFLEVSLEEVLKGIQKQIEFETEESCVQCRGSGAKAGTKPETCGTCNGQGQVVRTQGFFSMASTCPNCRGQGQIVKEKCTDCKGSGRKALKRKLMVTVPAGVETGTQLRLSGEGEGGYFNGPAGDLYVELKVKPHEEFQRSGQELKSTVAISYLQAALGAEVKIKTLEGEETLKLAPGIQPGDVQKLSGQGLPSLRNRKRGDLHVEVIVTIPKKLAKEEEELLRQLAKLKNETVEPNAKGFFKF